MGDNKREKLEELNKEIAKCKRCNLWKSRGKVVPGEGDSNAEIMLIGEAAGYHESIQGRPFVGAAGQLLTKLLQSIGIRRKEVFITNILKHRPPNNRGPLTEEIEACKIWLDKQIKVIQPKIIVTLGRFAMAKFIPDGKITQIHGQARWVNFGNLRFVVIPMFHPAAALRNGEVMEKIKDDFQKIPKILRSLDNQTGYNSINRSEEEADQLTLC